MSKADTRALAICEVIDYIADLAALEGLHVAGPTTIGHWGLTRDILKATYAEERRLAQSIQK